jgi:hypothetical protein
MYKIKNYSSTSIELNQSVEGETIEQKIERVTTNKEPIKDGAPLIYTERKDGVQAGYNIKTDRFEIAVEAMDKVTKSNLAQREHKAKLEVVKDSGAESIQGTEGTNN